jgi:hypothetical protein
MHRGYAVITHDLTEKNHEDNIRIMGFTNQRFEARDQVKNIVKEMITSQESARSQLMKEILSEEIHKNEEDGDVTFYPNIECLHGKKEGLYIVRPDDVKSKSISLHRIVRKGGEYGLLWGRTHTYEDIKRIWVSFQEFPMINSRGWSPTLKEDIISPWKDRTCKLKKELVDTPPTFWFGKRRRSTIKSS